MADSHHGGRRRSDPGKLRRRNSAVDRETPGEPCRIVAAVEAAATALRRKAADEAFLIGAHTSGRSFAPHVGTRHFTPRFSGRSRHFGTTHTGTTFNRSVRRTQRQHNFTQSNTQNRTLRNAAGVPSNTLRTLRRNGTAAITPQAARQGRFGSRFAVGAGRHHRFANIAAHRAWRRGLRAGFVPWYGPVFWPYAYSDIFDYAFWPDGYDDGFWFYAYDDFFDGLFWGEVGPPEEYAYAGPALAAAPRASYAGVQELCKQPGSGITAWPFADIERKVGLNGEQKQLLGDVRKAAAEAAATSKPRARRKICSR